MEYRPVKYERPTYFQLSTYANNNYCFANFKYAEGYVSISYYFKYFKYAKG